MLRFACLYFSIFAVFACCTILSHCPYAVLSFHTVLSFLFVYVVSLRDDTICNDASSMTVSVILEKQGTHAIVETRPDTRKREEGEGGGPQFLFLSLPPCLASPLLSFSFSVALLSPVNISFTFVAG